MTPTAILLSTAKILTGLRDTLPGTVVFYFQPAEEGPSDFIPDGKNTWGAKMMVQEGVMKSPKPDAVFGLHVWAGVPAGQIATAPAPPWPAPTTCASKSSANKPTPAARGTASTRSPSARKPSSACKPWSVGAPIFSSYPSVVSIGTINGGTRYNIIPESVDMSGTIRSCDYGIRQKLHADVRQTIENIAESGGAKSRRDHHRKYDPTINNPALTEKCCRR
jgi:amidohydrolase